MYELTIKTKYNTINIVVEDIEDEQVQEILNQPYVIEMTPKIYTGDINKAKVLKKGMIKSETPLQQRRINRTKKKV